MDLDHDACYRALLARDRRFDGRLFVAVKTTGIYCRPICPARTPKSANVIFFVRAAAAAEAGFRPCLRCRPEVSPELATWKGTSNTVSRALRLIESGALNEQDLEAFACRLGVGSRHLRRLFAHHLGASPVAVLQTQRVHLAKQLIHDTDLPMTEVALAAGFGSVRRFNETFKDLFGRPPSSLRRRRVTADVSSNAAITLRLPYSPPYAWSQVLNTLARTAIAGVESVQQHSYTRSFCIDGSHGLVDVRHGEHSALEITVHCTDIKLLQRVIAGVRRVFDLSADSSVIDSLLSKDVLLAPLVAAQPGLRAVGAWDSTEHSLRVALQYSAHVEVAASFALHHGTRLPQRLAGVYPGVTHVFPTPTQAVRAAAEIESDSGAALEAVARFLSEHADLAVHGDAVQELSDRMVQADVPRAIAQSIVMAQLHPSDACNFAEPGLVAALETATSRRLTRQQWEQRAQRWRPWRAYAIAYFTAAPLQCRALRNVDTDDELMSRGCL
jgi:AraC family transcriptional regulator, regulatory protein of adaptative response / DNA-3-methyladenine glycosylase II